jgi:hypothetical protein
MSNGAARLRRPGRNRGTSREQRGEARGRRTVGRARTHPSPAKTPNDARASRSRQAKETSMLTDLAPRRSFRPLSSRALLVTLAACAAACGISTEAPERSGDGEQAMFRGVDPTLQGTLSVLHGVADGAATETIYILNDTSGVRHSLSIPESVLRRMAGRPGMEGGIVSVTGPLGANGEMQVRNGFVMQPAAIATTGQRRMLNLLCRFAGGEQPAQEDATYFDRLFGTQYPGIADYFAKASYGKLDLSGAVTTSGWYELNDPIGHYQAMAASEQANAVVQDCLGLLQHDQDTQWEDFGGVNIILSENWRAEAFGGPLKVDDAHPNFPVTILSPLGFRSQLATAQAVGATLGMSWSSLTEARRLDSQWDLMSAGGTCAVVDPSLGCIAVQPIADTKRAMGWLGDDQVETGYGASMTTLLSPLGAPLRSASKKLAVFSLGNGAYVTAELRTKESDAYEQNLPSQEVLLHVVDGPTGESAPGTYRATVLDATPNTPDATGQDVTLKWFPAGGYIDQARGFGARVDWVNNDEFTLSMFRPGLLDVVTNLDADAQGWVNGPQIACGVTCSATYPPGTTVKLTATAGASSFLRSFSGCDSVTGNTCTIWDTTKPHTVYADFGHKQATNTCFSDCMADVCDQLTKAQCSTYCHKACANP